MDRITIFFLLVVASGLSLVLALLGLETLSTNRLGWVLLVIGIAYPTGAIISYWLQKRPFWQTNGKPVKEESGDLSFWAILPGMLVSFFASPLEYIYLAWLTPVFWMQALGLVLVALGILLQIWARRCIRGMYSGHLQVISGHALITLGPYHYMRHPSYTGFLSLCLGIAVGYGSILGFVAIPLLLLPGLAYRIHVEESLLRDCFGAEFNAYAHRVKKLIPGVW